VKPAGSTGGATLAVRTPRGGSRVCHAPSALGQFRLSPEPRKAPGGPYCGMQSLASLRSGYLGAGRPGCRRAQHAAHPRRSHQSTLPPGAGAPRCRDRRLRRRPAPRSYASMRRARAAWPGTPSSGSASRCAARSAATAASRPTRNQCSRSPPSTGAQLRSATDAACVRLPIGLRSVRAIAAWTRSITSSAREDPDSASPSPPARTACQHLPPP
jgi:hypothetical protein